MPVKFGNGVFMICRRDLGKTQHVLRRQGRWRQSTSSHAYRSRLWVAKYGSGSLASELKSKANAFNCEIFRLFNCVPITRFVHHALTHARQTRRHDLSIWRRRGGDKADGEPFRSQQTAFNEWTPLARLN